MQTKLTKRKKQFLDALRDGRGIITYACQKVGVSRQAYYKMKEKDEEFAKQVEDINEENIDFVESKLLTAINNEDITAIIFYLKTKGKKRGYVERTEHDVNANPFQELMESLPIDEDEE